MKKNLLFLLLLFPFVVSAQTSTASIIGTWKLIGIGTEIETDDLVLEEALKDLLTMDQEDMETISFAFDKHGIMRNYIHPDKPNVFEKHSYVLQGNNLVSTQGGQKNIFEVSFVGDQLHLTQDVTEDCVAEFENDYPDADIKIVKRTYLCEKNDESPLPYGMHNELLGTWVFSKLQLEVTADSAPLETAIESKAIAQAAGYKGLTIVLEKDGTLTTGNPAKPHENVTVDYLVKSDTIFYVYPQYKEAVGMRFGVDKGELRLYVNMTDMFMEEAQTLFPDATLEKVEGILIHRKKVR